MPYNIHFEITDDPADIWLVLSIAIYLRIALFLAINRIFFHWNITTNQILRLVKSNQSKLGKLKTKKSSCGEFCSFCLQHFSYYFSRKEWI